MTEKFFIRLTEESTGTDRNEVFRLRHIYTALLQPTEKYTEALQIRVHSIMIILLELSRIL